MCTTTIQRKSEIFIAIRTYGGEGKTNDRSEEDCKEEDTDRYQVYCYSVQQERGVGNRRTDITKTRELIKSDRHLYPF